MKKQEIKTTNKKIIKILVMSDNHGDIETMDRIIKRENPDYKFHCGDYLISMKEMEDRFDYFVLGNNDVDPTPLEYNVKISGIKFKILHGHTLGINIYYSNKLMSKVKNMDCDVLVHGHLHIPILLQEENKTIFCPGSTSYPRDSNGPTYGLIFIKNGELIFEHKKV